MCRLYVADMHSLIAAGVRKLPCSFLPPHLSARGEGDTKRSDNLLTQFMYQLDT